MRFSISLVVLGACANSLLAVMGSDIMRTHMQCVPASMLGQCQTTAGCQCPGDQNAVDCTGQGAFADRCKSSCNCVAATPPPTFKDDATPPPDYEEPKKSGFRDKVKSIFRGKNSKTTPVGRRDLDALAARGADDTAAVAARYLVARSELMDHLDGMVARDEEHDGGREE